jgi:hypothetical protein
MAAVIESGNEITSSQAVLAGHMNRVETRKS